MFLLPGIIQIFSITETDVRTCLSGRSFPAFCFYNFEKVGVIPRRGKCRCVIDNILYISVIIKMARGKYVENRKA